MNRWLKKLWALTMILSVSCSVMPPSVKNEAIPAMPFKELIQNAGQYVGQTVVLGGYVVEVVNETDLSRIIAVQAPLGMGDEPKSKDQTQGRLIIEYSGFLDPEVYKKNRRITIAGKLLGSSATEKDRAATYPYVRVAAAEMHLWGEERPLDRDPYWPYWRYPHPHPYLYPWGWYHPYVW